MLYAWEKGNRDDMERIGAQIGSKLFPRGNILYSSILLLTFLSPWLIPRLRTWAWPNSAARS